MKRLLLLSLTVLLILGLLYLGASLFGEETIKASVPVVALTTAAVFLPGGALHWKGLWLLIGILLGIVGFVISIGLFPDTVIGYLLGAGTPVLIATLLTMWTRTPAYFLAALFGIAATQGVYSVSFYTDPGGVAFNLPIALRVALAPMVLTYVVLLGLLALEPSLAPESLARSSWGSSRGASAAAPAAAEKGEVSTEEPGSDESEAEHRAEGADDAEPAGRDDSKASEELDSHSAHDPAAESATEVDGPDEPTAPPAKKSGAAE